jgi:hypothetical protein
MGVLSPRISMEFLEKDLIHEPSYLFDRIRLWTE